MKEIKNKIPTMIIIGILTYILLYYLYNYWSDGIYARFGSKVGLDMFYVFQESIYAYLIFGFLGTSLIVDTFYKNKQSKFQNMIIARTGYKKRMKYELKQVIKYSFLIRLVYNIFVMLLIELFISNIKFLECSSRCTVYSESPFISFIIYNLFSCIGFTVFSLFLYSISYFIKNQYAYKVSGVIAIIGLTVITSLLGNQLYLHFSNIKFANPFLQAIFSIQLIIPGMSSATTVTSMLEEYVWFLYTCICFVIYSLILIEIRKKKEMQNG